MKVEVLVDFPDDVLGAGVVITEAHIDALAARLSELGVGRLIWGYYGDGHGGRTAPAGYDLGRHNWTHYAQVYGAGRNPLAEAVAAGHRHGQDVYAYFKPYETGPGLMFPEGSPEAERWGIIPHIGGRLAWLAPFVVSHPHLRIQRMQDAATGIDERLPIRSIRLVKKDASPTRVRKHNLQIWTSDANYRYQQRDIEFECLEDVEPAAADVRDIDGAILTRKGDPVRVLTLSGLDLRDRYVLVTTDLQEGTPDFENSGTAIMQPCDAERRVIPGVFAGENSVYQRDRVDFRQWGLIFDSGRHRTLMALDAPNASGNQGFVAFARGRNEYLTGALCETEPEVQEFWLACLGEMLDAGVDGIDFRVENHSSHTDYSREYGFNATVMRLCGARGTDHVAKVRGAAYTEFLARAKALVASRGKAMRINLNIDLFRPDPPPARDLGYPANIAFEWARWIDEGLIDQAVLRSYHLRKSMLSDGFAGEMVARCAQRGIPVTFNHHVFADEPWYLEEFERVARDGRFSGCILYEANSFTRVWGEAECEVTLDIVRRMCRAARGE